MFFIVLFLFTYYKLNLMILNFYSQKIVLGGFLPIFVNDFESNSKFQFVNIRK